MGRPAQRRTPNADADAEPFQRAGDAAVNAETKKTLEPTQSVTRPPDNPPNPAPKDQRSNKAREDEEGKGPKENPEFCDVDRDPKSLGEFVAASSRSTAGGGRPSSSLARATGGTASRSWPGGYRTGTGWGSAARCSSPRPSR